MKNYELGKWNICINEISGNVCYIERSGLQVVSQTEPMLSLAIDGMSTNNNQNQMHNVDLIEVVGNNAKLLNVIKEDDVLKIKINLGDGFIIKSYWTATEDWIKMTVDVSYEDETPHRLRYIKWHTDTMDAETLRRVEPFCPGYTMNRSEPYDLARPIGAYRHKDLLAHGLFGEHVPAYRPGILGAYDPVGRGAVCSWFVSEMFPCYTPSWTHGESLSRNAQIHCARWMCKGDCISIGDFYFGAFHGSRKECILKAVASFVPYRWDRNDDYIKARRLRVCELFVGSKSDRVLFNNYDEVIARLKEISDLGFNAIEIMPHMPFPSYSVYDFMDLDATYGSEDGVRHTVQKAHELGMKVIIDMVFHGPRDFISDEVNAPRSPYLDRYPDWFMLHESGDYARTYTRSLDMANPNYQLHIGDCMLYYLRELKVDGFRLDAQMWSETPNWDDKSPRYPYESVLAGMRMMDGISARIHNEFPEAFFYTEANGPYSAKSHEYRYNYDMHWMFPGLARVIDPRGAPIATLNLISMNTLSWYDAALWLDEMQLTSPSGMAIVYQTDSHDSAEWGGFPGGQYNFEAYGSSVHRVLYGMVNFLDGALMSFYGAHKGNEEYYQKIGQLMRDCIMVDGTCDLTGARQDDGKTIAILWRNKKEIRLYIGNLENQAKNVTINLDSCSGSSVATDRLSARDYQCTEGQIKIDLEPYDTLILDMLST